MNRRLRLVFCLVPAAWMLAAAGGAAEPKQEDATADLAKLQGKWKAVEDSTNGVATPIDHGLVIEFQKDVEIGYDAEGGVAGKQSIKLDPSKSPKEIDETCIFLPIFPKEEGRTHRSIYQLDGDELKIAVPSSPYYGERPKGFTTRKGDHFFVTTYKRVKP